MKNSIKLGQGLAWAAWLVFIASLFMPMETNSLAGPCAWPCAQPFIGYSWQNATYFVLSMIAFPLKWLEVIYIAVFDPVTLRKIPESTVALGIHAIIGLGQFLIVLAPLWPAKINKMSWQRLHLWMVTLSALSALAYGLFPDLRLGLELLRGYYVWGLSFILLIGASILMQTKKSGDFSAETGHRRSGSAPTGHRDAG